ncbi:hypothetical protein GOV11_00880 [Candidatus Woesearchaeota archaeon]|nr:hypothetical protein [Candidatus Woesearchaeota archaeon]
MKHDAESKEHLQESVVRSTLEPKEYTIIYKWSSFATGTVKARNLKEAKEKAMLPWVTQELDEDLYPTEQHPDVSIEDVGADDVEVELTEEEVNNSMERCE